MELMLIILTVFMIIVAIIAVETEKLLASIISFGGIGFLITIAFMILRAPDIAITQVVVEVISLIFLIKLTLNKDLKATEGHVNVFKLGGIIVILAVIFLFTLKIFEGIEFGKPVALMSQTPSLHYIEKGMAKTQSPNIVTGILFDFRAYDTIGEATVLFTSIIGAAVILRKKAKNK